MSFEDQYHSASSGSSGRFSARVGVDASPGGSSSSSTIRANIARMGDNIQRMARMVHQLGTPKDTQELRSQLRSMRKETTILSRQTKDNIQLLGTSEYQNADWRIQQERLRKDFESELKRFQEVNTRAIELEKAYVAKARGGWGIEDLEQGSAERIPDLLIREETENERMSLIQAEEQRQSAIRMDNMVQYNENLIAERFEDVKQIEKDVMEINEIFRDLAVMVDDQGEKLDKISDYIQSTADNTQAASEEVDGAYEAQQKARKRTCLLALILLAAVVIVVLIIAQSFRR